VTARQHDLPPAARRRLLLRAMARPALTTTGLVFLYYLLPLGEHLNGPTAASLLGGMVLFGALLTWQVRQIRAAEHPRLRAIEALSFSGPLFILIFSALYYATSKTAPASFSEGLSRTDSLYFTVTVFATVGFGDIVPVTQSARVTVLIQMIGDLVLVGVVAHAIVGAVREGLNRNEPGTQPDETPELRPQS
jgi:voltage-gated potassium channel